MTVPQANRLLMLLLWLAGFLLLPFLALMGTKPNKAPVLATPTPTPAPRIDFTTPPATPALEWEIDRGNGPECVTGPVGFGGEP